MTIKIGVLNISGIDASESERCNIPESFVKNINIEKLGEKLNEILEKLKETGVTEIDELNVSLLDLSGSIKVNYKNYEKNF
jgi:hypothetical protein